MQIEQYILVALVGVIAGLITFFWLLRESYLLGELLDYHRETLGDSIDQAKAEGRSGVVGAVKVYLHHYAVWLPLEIFRAVWTLLSFAAEYIQQTLPDLTRLGVLSSVAMGLLLYAGLHTEPKPTGSRVSLARCMDSKGSTSPKAIGTIPVSEPDTSGQLRSKGPTSPKAIGTIPVSEPDTPGQLWTNEANQNARR